MAKTVKAANPIDRMFRAFSDRTRLRILSLLQNGECCVGDMVEVLKIQQPIASRHLAYLRRTGLVQVRKAKMWSYYSLAPACGAFHGKLLECLSCCFQEVPQIQTDLLRARELKKAGGCCPGTESSKPSKKKPSGECCSGLKDSAICLTAD